MDSFDEIRQFPVLTNLPKPKSREYNDTISNSNNRKLKTAIKPAIPRATPDTKILPGILKTSKTNLKKSEEKYNPSTTSVFVGFNATHVHLDTSKPLPHSQSLTSSSSNQVNNEISQLLNPGLHTIVLNNHVTIPKKQEKQDDALVELRSYTSLMDEYSLHNFMIWNGNTLRDTPEFQSYYRSYKNQWSYVESIITQLEKLMKDNCIKLAIISGNKVIHYGSLNLPYLQLYQLLDCVANSDQIRPQLSSFSGDNQDQILRATIKIQTLGRRWFAIYRYKNLKKRLFSAIIIQSIIRRYVQRCRTHYLLQQLVQQNEERWKNNYKNLYDIWSQPNNQHQRYLIIIIPAITASEYVRLNLSNLQGIQNSIISSLYLLADPRIDIVYITPCQFTSIEINYIHKFLALMNISIVTNRLKFLVPELIHQLPSTLPLNQMLWYSSSTLRKLKSIIKFYKSSSTSVPTSTASSIPSSTLPTAHGSSSPLYISSNASPTATGRDGYMSLPQSNLNSPIPPSHNIQLPSSSSSNNIYNTTLNYNNNSYNNSYNNTLNNNNVTTTTATTTSVIPNKRIDNQILILSSEVTWVEKRIATYLGINIMSSEPIVATEFTSKSQSKRLFMECNMNIPIGAHDIYNEDDLLIAITRLISSNLSINRWLIRLNIDQNNESTICLDTNKLPIIQSLKVEQQVLINTSNDTECWYERHVQLNARKRILNQIKEYTLNNILIICRNDLYPSWEYYLPFLIEFGVVIEAEPPLLQGRVESNCYISPCGDIHVIQGGQILHDESYQKQGIIYPQTLIHPKSLETATQAISSKMYDMYGVIGYMTVYYIIYYDAFDGMTRMWANGLKFGMNSSYCALGTLNNLLSPWNSMLYNDYPLIPNSPEGRCCVYIPTAIHPPLSSSRDDIFFKLCKMNGISYDSERKTGVLFFLVDSIVGGVISILVISDTKIKAMECGVQVLSFISKNFGKAEPREQIKDWATLGNILKSLKSTLKKEITRANEINDRIDRK